MIKIYLPIVTSISVGSLYSLRFLNILNTMQKYLCYLNIHKDFFLSVKCWILIESMLKSTLNWIQFENTQMANNDVHLCIMFVIWRLSYFYISPLRQYYGNINIYSIPTTIKFLTLLAKIYTNLLRQPNFYMQSRFRLTYKGELFFCFAINNVIPQRQTSPSYFSYRPRGNWYIKFTLVRHEKLYSKPCQFITIKS